MTGVTDERTKDPSSDDMKNENKKDIDLPGLQSLRRPQEQRHRGQLNRTD